MAQNEKEYRRLPGNRRLLGYSSLWLGKDHVLCVDSGGFSEDYKRFYYPDIQAIIVRKTIGGTVWNFVLGVLGFLFLILALKTFQTGVIDGETLRSLIADLVLSNVLNGILAGLFLFLFLTNLLRGATCVCQIQTAVYTKEIRSLSRLRTARRALSLIKDPIEIAQGKLTPDDLTSRAQEYVQASMANVGSEAHASKTNPVVSHSHGRIHEILFYMLLIKSVCASLYMLPYPKAALIVNSTLFAAILGLAVAALVKQQRTDISDSVRKVVWASLGLLGLNYFIRVTYGIVLGMKKALTPATAQEPLALDWSLYEPDYMVLHVCLAMCAFVIGAIGLILLREFRREYVLRQSALSRGNNP